jgi:hypothetical protein
MRPLGKINQKVRNQPNCILSAISAISVVQWCGGGYTSPGMLTLINPIPRPDPFDHPDWAFEAKFDGFRAAADTVRGRLISRNATGCSVSRRCLLYCRRATAYP